MTRDAGPESLRVLACQLAVPATARAEDRDAHLRHAVERLREAYDEATQSSPL